MIKLFGLLLGAVIAVIPLSVAYAINSISLPHGVHVAAWVIAGIVAAWYMIFGVIVGIIADE